MPAKIAMPFTARAARPPQPGPQASAAALGSAPTMLAWVLLALGAAVMAGWIFRVPTLTQLLPGLTSMVFNTALCFALMAIALLATARPEHRQARWPRLLAVTVVVLASLNLVQIYTGWSLGINLPPLHAWLRDGNPKPGQMSLPTSVEFLLAGSSFLIQQSGAMRQRHARRLVRVTTALIFSIATLALVGYLLQLEPLYDWYAFTHMALHTASGLALLSLALWFRQNELGALDGETIDERILTLGSWTLVLVALVAGVTGAWILKQEAEGELRENLRRTHQARVDVLDTSLNLRATRAALVSAMPDIRSRLNASPETEELGQPSDLNWLAKYGFSRIELRDSQGRQVAQMGGPEAAADLAIAIGSALPGKAVLVWAGGFRLRQRFEFAATPGPPGELLIEQTLPRIDEQLSADTAYQQFELCGRGDQGLRCFPNGAHPHPYEPQEGGPATRLSTAGLGTGAASGVSQFRDEHGDFSTVAYGPVGSTRLLASTSRQSAELLAPLRERVNFGLLLVTMVTVGGALVLRRSIQPLTEALSEAERRYRTVVDNLHEGVMLLDARGKVLAANPAASRILGMDSGALVAARIDSARWRLIHEDGSVCALDDYPSMRALRSGRGEKGVRMGAVDAEGRLSWLEINTMPVTDRGTIGVLVTFADVTEQRLSQQRLQEAESRYQMMIDQVLDYAILMLDSQGRVVSVNQGAERIQGYAAHELIGSDFTRLFSEDDRAADKPRALLEDAALRGRAEFEGWCPRKDGTRFWGLVALSAVRDAQRQLIGYSKVTRDLTERHRAEQAVAEARRRMQAMIDSSPFGIVATDLQGTIVAINPAGERMTGYSREELVGKVTPAVYHDAEEIRTRARELSEETGTLIEPGLDAFVHRAKLGFAEERDWTCVRKDGLRFPIHSAITPLRDPGGTITGYLGVAYDITERKRMEDYTRHIAHHDFLTGLPMRRLLEDRLSVAMRLARREHRKVALLMIDLDHFKRINDSLGHHVGDELLKVVAERLLGCVRDSDTVARMGGDEFVILLPDLGEVSQAERVAHLAVEQVSRPICIGPHELHMSPSVGIAMFPNDAEDSSALLKNADAAMYAAKTAGRGCYRVFSRNMQQEADQRMLLERELRLALQKDQLELHYQPQVCLRSGDVVGMEALLRWTHPQRGPISPAVFIPVAEETGLILALGEWVVRTACHGAKRIQDKTGAPLRLAVNLSPRQFRSPQLLECISSALRDSKLDPTHLELEITEGVLMENADDAIQRLVEIRRSGVSIAVDDFGTGYSSLSYITRFAIDTLKIDRSFVSRLPESASDAAVAQAIISLSRSLGIRVVAEGIERENQLAYFRERHCDQAQGFLLGKPSPEEFFSAQGFHFGAATPEAQFVAEFPGLQAGSRARVRGLH